MFNLRGLRKHCHLLLNVAIDTRQKLLYNVGHDGTATQVGKLSIVSRRNHFHFDLNQLYIISEMKNNQVDFVF